MPPAFAVGTPPRPTVLNGFLMPRHMTKTSAAKIVHGAHLCIVIVMYPFLTFAAKAIFSPIALIQAFISSTVFSCHI